MDLPQQKLAEFFQTGDMAYFKKGDVIIHGDDDQSDVFLIEKGFVKLYTIHKQGFLNLQLIKATGDIFPLFWVFNEKNNSVYYEALCEGVAWRVPREAFLTFIGADPEIMNLIWEKANGLFKSYYQKVEILQQKTAYERLVRYLIFLAEQFGEKKDHKAIAIRLPLTHQDIADSVNITRETASRELERISRKQLVTYQKGDHTILINDLPGLEKELR